MKYYINWVFGFISESVNWEPREIFFFLRGSFVPTILFFFINCVKQKEYSLPFSITAYPAVRVAVVLKLITAILGWSRTSHQYVVERQPTIHGNSDAILQINLAYEALDCGRETEHQGRTHAEREKSTQKGLTTFLLWAHGANHCTTKLH